MNLTAGGGGNPTHKVFLEGYDVANNKNMQLLEKIENSAKNDKWRLQFLNKGETRILSLSGAEGEDYDEGEASCNTEDIIEVIKEDEDGKAAGIKWEKGINYIEFELKDCGKGMGEESCSIQIKKDIGLRLKTLFKPKEIFYFSRI